MKRLMQTSYQNLRNDLRMVKRWDLTRENSLNVEYSEVISECLHNAELWFVSQPNNLMGFKSQTGELNRNRPSYSFPL